MTQWVLIYIVFLRGYVIIIPFCYVGLHEYTVCTIPFDTHFLAFWSFTISSQVLCTRTTKLEEQACFDGAWINVKLFYLKTVDTIGNCQRPVFSLGVSQHVHKITTLWKFQLNRSSSWEITMKEKTPLSHEVDDAWFRDHKF